MYSFSDLDCSEIYVEKIEVISGKRPAGLSIYNTHGRNSSGFFYIWDGEAVLTFSDKDPLCVKSGMLIYLPRKHRYVMQYSKPDTVFVTVNFQMTDENGENVCISDNVTVISNNDKDYKIANIMKNFEMCSGSKNLSALFRKKELLYRLLAYTAGSNDIAFYENTSSKSSIFKGVALLHKCYLENLPIEEFAKASNVSVSSFRSLFKAKFGTSPVHYRNKLRIERAMVLLAQGDSTIEQIAYACGFENIGYFYRYFKKITGYTPVSYMLKKNERE